MNPAIQRVIKRIFDVCLSLIGFVLLSPLFLVIALVVKLDSKGSVLFKHARPGKNGKIFNLYKFRTMKDLRDKNGKFLSDEIRLTKVGKFLRRTSLDEIPELWNVLKGDMSIIGPRPLVIQYLNRYSHEQARRHEVVPGITGWAQVNGRNALSWEDKFRHDVWYVDHWSLWLDTKIFFMTLINVIKGEGINQPGFATAEEFMGSEDKDL